MGAAVAKEWCLVGWMCSLSNSLSGSRKKASFGCSSGFCCCLVVSVGQWGDPAGFAWLLPLGVICWLSLCGGLWGGGEQSWLNWKRSAAQVFRKREKTIWTCKLNKLWCRRYRGMVSVASCQACLWSNCVSDLEEEVKGVHLKRILIKHNEFDWSSGLLWAGDGSLIKGRKGRGLAPGPFTLH